jgi:hypothetical protein
VTHFPPVEESDASADALDSASVDVVLGALSKALRAFHMYEDNNPVFHRFRDSLREEFRALWSKTDLLELTVHEEGFGYGGHVYKVGTGRDAMAFAFYKDGIRYLKFMPGFEDEVGAFLEAVRRARQSENDANDMISVLWEEDFASFQYGYVDLLGEGATPADRELGPNTRLSDEGLKLDLSLDPAEDGSEQNGAAAASGVAAGLSRDDFDDTLYFLDPAELEEVKEQLEQEMGRDLRRDVLNALFDRLEEKGRAERQDEIMGILDQLLPLFLSRGEMRNAARILEELGNVLSGEPGANASLAERVQGIFKRLGDPKVLEQFVQALEDGAVSPDSEEVSLFFSRLQPEALPVLVRFAEMTGTPSVAARLASAIDGLASRHPAAVEALLGSDDPVLVKGAARTAGRSRLSQSVRALHTAMVRADREVRLAVVEALVAIRTTPALQALVTVLDDDDREVRIAAARALGAVRFVSAREPLAAALDDRRLKDADLTEKMVFYEAYGAVGGAAAVERLDHVLNDKGFLGRRAPSELRACAALGLGKVGTPAARAALEKRRADEDLVVRNAVLRALSAEAAR